MKNFRQQSKQSRPKKSTLISGLQPVIEALKSGQQLERIYLQNNSRGSAFAEIAKLANMHHVPLNYVPVPKLESFNVSNHEGCIAVISKIKYYDLQEVISFLVEKGETPLLLILDGITDIRNIGGIARTAYSTGVHALIIPDKGVGALNEDAVLTSAGALEKITVCRVNSLMKAVDELHLNGFTVYASDAKAEKNLNECDFTGPAAIIMGSEEKGIYPALLKISDTSFKIPMANDFESLNVSVATGVILYNAMQQRLMKTGKG